MELRDIGSAVKGKKPLGLCPIKRNEFVPYIDINAFEHGEFREYANPQSARVAEKGDILIVWDGARSGLVGKMPTRGAVGSTLAVIQPSGIEYDFVYYFLQSQFQELNTCTRGTGIPHINPNILWNLRIPLPPLAEQKRIVAKVEELLARVNNTQVTLSKVPAILKRFRQSVLAAACSGRLTEEWRNHNMHQEAAAKSDVVTKEEAELPELPIGWNWAASHQIGRVITGNTPSKKQSVYYGGTIPFYKPTDLDAGYWVAESRDTLTEQGATHARILPLNSVLITCIGATIGKVGLCRVAGATNQQINAVVPRTDRALGQYLFMAYSSPFEQEQIKKKASETTLPIINKGRFELLPIPLPPLPEQREIVRRVERLFALADAIEKQTAAAAARVGKLTQAILAKAFRGELVPTEAQLAAKEGRDFEPAAVLLKRITEEKKQGACKKSGGGGPPPSKV